CGRVNGGTIRPVRAGLSGRRFERTGILSVPARQLTSSAGSDVLSGPGMKRPSLLSRRTPLSFLPCARGVTMFALSLFANGGDVALPVLSWWQHILLGLVILAALLLLAAWLTTRYIPNQQVGVVEKLWSNSGSVPEGRIIALDGEAGFQAD